MALLALVGGCDSESASDSTETTASTTGGEESGASDTASESATSAAGGGECDSVGTDAVTDAVGEPMKLDTAGDGSCMFSADAGGGPQIWVLVTEFSQDQQAFVDQAKQLCDEPITDVDAGDAAWTCLTANPQGTVVTGNQAAAVDAKDFETDDAAYDALAKLLPQITL